jgi:hypothetical protein
MAGSKDRITVPFGLRNRTHDTERELPTADSVVRPIVPLFAVPWLVMTYEDLRGLPLDHRAGFILSRVDGRCTVEMIVDMASLPPDDTMEILRRLVELGAIELRDRPSVR